MVQVGIDGQNSVLMEDLAALEALEENLPREADKTIDKVIAPDVLIQAHSASLGLTFYTASLFPNHYQGGVFVGQHGSWNRAQLTGYKVVYVPFQNGKPSGLPEDFLTGFLKGGDSDAAYGRPVGVTVAKDGALLVADDVGNIVWRVTPPVTH